MSKKERVSFQVLLLNNDADEDVAVREAEDINFFQVKEHLRTGGSVFITSKNQQKILYPKGKSQQGYTRSRRMLGFLVRKQMRHS
jgi:hypothetical protein